MPRNLSVWSKRGMWIGLIVGGIGGGLGLVVGVLVPLMVAPGPTKYMGVAIALPMIILFAFVFRMIFKKILSPLMEADKILETGVQTPGKLVKIWETGTYINRRPLLGMLVEVKPRFSPSYQVETKSMISMLEIARYQPGAALMLRVDQQDKTKIAIEGLMNEALPETPAP